MNPCETFVADDFEQLIQAFETARYNQKEIELSDFFPSPNHPRRVEIIQEIICIDIEWNWTEGVTRRVEDYYSVAGDLFQRSDFRKAVAFEEYRQRCLAYELVRREDYAQKFAIDTSDWPAPPSLESESFHSRSSVTIISEIKPVVNQTKPVATEIKPVVGESQPAQSEEELLAKTNEVAVPVVISNAKTPLESEPSCLGKVRPPSSVVGEKSEGLSSTTVQEYRPKCGEWFQHFELVELLGEGAFAQVFLAKQEALAGRKVVLKIAKRLFGEPEKLAQLQHTNIVPVYSVHQQEGWHAICMPYVGRVTLAHVIEKIESLESLTTKANHIRTIIDQLHTATQSEEIEPRSSPSLIPVPTSKLPNRLEKMNYIDSALWIISRLAGGLAHAHERGLLHRDIKPANILLSDEGEPMLLDFNVATSLDNPEASSAGTLRYMSPQQLRALQTGRKCLDIRNDIYSLGLVLFELLTGRFPWPYQRVKGLGVGELLWQQRKDKAPNVREFNPAVNRTIATIVQGMLEPDIEKRYANAQQVQEDIEAYFANRPLVHRREPISLERVQRWRRRHPRLCATLSVALFAVLPIVVPVVMVYQHRQKIERMESVQKFENNRELFREVEYHLTARLDEATHRQQGLNLGRALLEQYHVLDSENWTNSRDVRHLSLAQQQELRESIGQLLLFVSRAEEKNEEYVSALRINEMASQILGEQTPVGVWQQRVRILENLGRLNEAEPWRGLSQGVDSSELGELNRIHDLISQGEYKQALGLCETLTRKNPAHYLGWFARGQCQFQLGQIPDSIASYSVCVALRPDSVWASYNRAIVLIRVGRWQEALEDLNRVLKLKSHFSEAKINRAIVYRALGKYREAESDVNEVIAEEKSARAYFLRSDIRRHLKDEKGAQADFETAQQITPTDEQGWIDRGLAYLEKDSRHALADFEQALKLNPRSRDALQNKVYVLAEKLGKIEDAIASLDQMLQWYPDYLPARGARGVYHARLGNVNQARQDVEYCRKHDRSPFGMYQQASLYALLSKHDPEAAQEALSLFEKSLQAGFHDFALIESDKDIDPIRQHPTFVRALDLAKRLHKSPENK
ncbi:MAG: tetratricopeptide repeat protein [Gemmataceae bacterium]|nr:tetratricopeptide repeat protein [Gemmataceae bacterium]